MGQKIVPGELKPNENMYIVVLGTTQKKNAQDIAKEESRCQEQQMAAWDPSDRREIEERIGARSEGFSGSTRSYSLRLAMRKLHSGGSANPTRPR